jgi:hypothetical protein
MVGLENSLFENSVLVPQTNGCPVEIKAQDLVGYSLYLLLAKDRVHEKEVVGEILRCMNANGFFPNAIYGGDREIIIDSDLTMVSLNKSIIYPFQDCERYAHIEVKPAQGVLAMKNIPGREGLDIFGKKYVFRRSDSD